MCHSGIIDIVTQNCNIVTSVTSQLQPLVWKLRYHTLTTIAIRRWKRIGRIVTFRRTLNIWKYYVPTPRAAANTNKHLEYILRTKSWHESSGHCNVLAHTASGWMGGSSFYIGWSDASLRRWKATSPPAHAALCETPSREELPLYRVNLKSNFN